MNVRVRDVSALSGSDRDELFQLFVGAFKADRSGFEHDLKGKDKVLTIHDKGGLLAFTSLRIEHPEPGVRLLFSGDTFACPDARIGHRLPALWARYVYSELEPDPERQDYWLLLCSGYRTYRILPTCFQRYAPGPSEDETLSEKRDRWAAEHFGERYKDGVVTPEWATPLHQAQPPVRLQSDPHVLLFGRLNPGYERGEELVCLVPLERSNLSEAGRRLVSPRVHTG